MRIFDSVKALIDGGVEKKSASPANITLEDLVGPIPTTSGISVTASTALSVPALLHGVRLISETCGSTPLKLYHDKDGSKEAAKDHPAYRLVHNRANEWTSAGQLRVSVSMDAIMHGAGYAEVVRYGDGRPFELHRLKPGSVQRRFEDSGEPFYIVQRERGRQQRLSFRDMLYLPAFGEVSPVRRAKEAIGFAMNLERYGSKFFANMAMMKPILRIKPSGDEATQANKATNIRRSFENTSQDASPIMVTSDVESEFLTMKSTDAQYIENRLEQINEIARAIGVPPTMLYQLDRGTWSNTEQMAAGFLQLCLRPWLDRWQDAYAAVLLTEDEQDSHYFEFVIDDLQRADAAGRAEIFGKLVAMRAMTPNEVRAAMNLPAIEGGDELANPYTTTTITGPATAPAKKDSA